MPSAKSPPSLGTPDTMMNDEALERYLDMAFVSTYQKIYERDIPVGEMEIRIRPQFEQTFEHGIAADVTFEGLDGKHHPFADEKAKAILTEIKRGDPGLWSEIEEAAEDNFHGRD